MANCECWTLISNPSSHYWKINWKANEKPIQASVTPYWITTSLSSWRNSILSWSFLGLLRTCSWPARRKTALNQSPRITLKAYRHSMLGWLKSFTITWMIQSCVRERQDMRHSKNWFAILQVILTKANGLSEVHSSDKTRPHRSNPYYSWMPSYHLWIHRCSFNSLVD